jgi:nitroreductase
MKLKIMTPPANENPLKKDIFETILARRSVRAYAQNELDRNTVQTLLEAAVRAPTAMHQEPWAFIVVQNRQLLKQLSDLAKPLFIERLHRSPHTGGHAPDIFTNPDFNIFHDAGTLIVICAHPSHFSEADCWLAAENLMLVACAIGLGSCVIGSAVAALNTPEVKAKLGIPAEFNAVAPIIVGVPSGETAATSRKDPLLLVWKQ